MRHSWNYEEKLGYAICENCSLEVKEYEVKRGGLPRCDPDKALEYGKPEECLNHVSAAIAGSLNCWYCGKMYTEPELKLGQKLLKALITSGIKQSNLLEILENPQI